MTVRGEAIMDAAAEARKIADRLKIQATGKTGRDHDLKLAESIGARMVGIKLIELADRSDAAAKREWDSLQPCTSVSPTTGVAPELQCEREAGHDGAHGAMRYLTSWREPGQEDTGTAEYLEDLPGAAAPKPPREFCATCVVDQGSPHKDWCHHDGLVTSPNPSGGAPDDR